MRRALILIAFALAPTAAFAASLGIPLDQSIRLALSAPAHDVIVGNPAIADVSIADQRHVVVTGKTAGVTNLIVTDAAGRTIFDRQIVIEHAGLTSDAVTLVNGPTAVTYACTPTCVMADPEAEKAQMMGTFANAFGSAFGGAMNHPTGTPNTSAIQASPAVP